MKQRTLITVALTFALGLLVFSAGIAGLSYERALRSSLAEYQVGNSFAAIKILERVVDLPFSDARTRYNLGMALLDMASYDEAGGAFRKFASVTNDPALQAEGYFLLAWLFVIKAEYDRSVASSLYGQALAYLTEAMRLDPDHKDAKNLYERLRHLLNLGGTPTEQKEQKLSPDPGKIPGQGQEPKP